MDSRGSFLVDFLLPAELFPLVLVGGLALGWASLRAHLLRRWVLSGLGLAVLSLITSQGIAEISGLASGAIKPAGFPWIAVLVTLGLYVLAVFADAIAEIVFLRRLGRPAAQA